MAFLRDLLYFSPGLDEWTPSLHLAKVIIWRHIRVRAAAGAICVSPHFNVGDARVLTEFPLLWLEFFHTWVRPLENYWNVCWKLLCKINCAWDQRLYHFWGGAWRKLARSLVKQCTTTMFGFNFFTISILPSSDSKVVTPAAHVKTSFTLEVTNSFLAKMEASSLVVSTNLVGFFDPPPHVRCLEAADKRMARQDHHPVPERWITSARYCWDVDLTFNTRGPPPRTSSTTPSLVLCVSTASHVVSGIYPLSGLQMCLINITYLICRFGICDVCYLSRF